MTKAPALLPEGLRDRLPQQAEAASRVIRALVDAMRAHGYGRVSPPLAEFRETLGGDDDRATRDLPSYTLADASAGYDFERFRVQVNVRNIFDKHYFVNNYQTLYYGNVVGEPRSVTVSLRATF